MFPHRLAPTGSSLAENRALTSSLRRVYLQYPSRKAAICQGKKILFFNYLAVLPAVFLSLQHFFRTFQRCLRDIGSANDSGQLPLPPLQIQRRNLGIGAAFSLALGDQ